jgi:hypothetical protein
MVTTVFLKKENMNYLLSILVALSLLTNKKDITIKAEHPYSVTTKEGILTKKTLSTYFNLKEALIDENTEKASALSAVLVSNLKQLSKRYKSSEFDQLVEYATAIRLSNNIQEQRKSFANLSETIIPFVRVSKIDEDVFVKYCSEALDKEGAYWLSDRAEIRNPYFGQENLRCGEVVEII